MVSFELSRLPTTLLSLLLSAYSPSPTLSLSLSFSILPPLSPPNSTPSLSLPFILPIPATTSALSLSLSLSFSLSLPLPPSLCLLSFSHPVSLPLLLHPPYSVVAQLHPFSISPSPSHSPYHSLSQRSPPRSLSFSLPLFVLVSSSPSFSFPLLLPDHHPSLPPSLIPPLKAEQMSILFGPQVAEVLNK